MKHIPFPIFSEEKTKSPIYVVGDSHCMSSAWQTINVKDQAYVLTPKLVTGLKCWHLRSACRFYTKRNFESAIRTIPAGSPVIFIFGEIDCREGLLLAVEKGKYETIEEGIDLAVKVYITALEDLAKAKKYKIFVHPIVPVLDVTRKVVVKFNAVLKTKTQQSKQLHYVDFFDSLLTAAGNFNAVFGLDGTHMSPRYVPLMEAAIKQLNVPLGFA